MKKVLLALAVTVASFAAQAEMNVEGNIGLTSDYRYRGISQTQTEATLQAGFDFKESNGKGIYLGNLNSGVSKDLYPGTKGVETDIYGGYRMSVGKATVDIGAIRYIYWGNQTFDTSEVYLGAELGPVAVKASHSVKDYFGTANSKGTRYYEANFAQPAGKFTLVAHAGYTDVANQSTNDYADYNVGVTTDVYGINLGARWYTNNMKTAYQTANTVNGKALYKDAFVFTASKSF